MSILVGFSVVFPKTVSAQESSFGIVEETNESDEDLTDQEPQAVDSGNWDNWSDLPKLDSSEQTSGQAQLTALPVVDPSGLEKAMEEALRESMIEQARAYYPMIRSISLESSDETVKIEIAYQASSEKDLISLTSNLNKEQMSAQIQILSPLLQRSEEMSMQGDLQLIQQIQFLANPSLTATLGPEANIAFIQRINFKLLKPVRFNVKQFPGLIRIEMRPYLAGEEERADEEQDEAVLSDVTFKAPALPQTTEQVFGQSFQNQRAYEEEVNLGGEPTLLEQLERRRPSGLIFVSPYTNYSSGISQKSVIADEKEKAPRFGSLEYWKKHISGVLTNTARLLKRQRGQHFILNEEPALAFVYERKGAANVRLGYNFQRQFPFFNQKIGGLAPADGVVRNDFQGGVTFITESPWQFSFQNRLGIFTSENTGADAKFGDRLTQYRYEAGNAVRYNLKRGFVQLGAGMKFETQERAIRNRDIESYLSLLWYRPLSKKLAGRMEYNHTHRFIEEGQPELDKNVHKVRMGFEYKPNKNGLLKPGLGIAFYDGEAISGLIGDLSYTYFINDRNRIRFGYTTDFVRSRVSSFGQASLNNRRVTSNFSDGNLIRYHIWSVLYDRKISKRMSGQIQLSYRNETQLEIEPKDKFEEYRFSVKLRRHMSKKWVAELSYALFYLDAYEARALSSGELTKLDQGNTRHEAMFRLYRYFGESQ